MEFIASARFKLQGQEFAIPLDRSAAQYAIAGAVSLGSATFAAWLPARKAAHVDPVDILRGAA
jgi:lipoprotein-releasing system permease protein